MSVNESSQGIDETLVTRSSSARPGRGSRGPRRGRLGQTTSRRSRSTEGGHDMSNESPEELTKSMMTSMSHLTSQLTAALNQLHVDMNSLKTSLVSVPTSSKLSTDIMDNTPKRANEVRNVGYSTSLEAQRQSETKQGESKRENLGTSFMEGQSLPRGTQQQREYEVSARRADDWIETLWTHGAQSLEPASANQVPMVTQQLIPPVGIDVFDGDPRNWETFIDNFKALVHDVIPSDAQRMAILLQYLSPRLRSSVASQFRGPDMYAQTLTDLRRMFGNRNAIIDTHIRGLLNISPMKSTGKNEVQRFFYDVHRAVGALRVKGAEEELRSRATLQIVVSRMNRKMQYGWAKRCYKLHPKVPALSDLDNWLEELVMINNSLEWDDSEPRDRYQKVPRRPNPSPNVLASLRKDVDCPLCNDMHLLSACPMFLSLPLRDRAETIKKFGRCFACIDGCHRIRVCKSRETCGFEGCKQRHHPLLHDAPHVFAPPPKASNTNSESSPPHVGANSVGPQRDDILLAVVTADIHANGKTLRVSALLDPGSEATLIKESVARQLELNGPKRKLRLSTFHGMDPTFWSETVDFQLSSVDRRHTFAVRGALTVPRLNVANRKVDWRLVKQKWDHLRSIETESLKRTDVVLLIGMDVDEAHEQYQIVKPPKGVRAPKAVETPFGWCLIGCSPNEFRRCAPRTNDPLTVNHIAKSQSEEELISIVRKSWTLESLGIKRVDKELLSADDKRALDILQSSTKRVGGHYECRLLWKDSSTSLPNNLPAAEKRFGMLENRFRRDPTFGKAYEATIEEYLSMGHARKVEPHATGSRCWFLPHHGVRSSSKPGNVRVVFDASARTNGVSLNDVLLPGPNQLTDILSVLLRFRERPVAVSADIQRMFHQVRVAREDRDVLRFLWREPGAEQSLEHYQMLVHIFGAICSPAVCTYVLRKTAEDNRAEYPLIADKVTTNFYVDNYLDSFDTVREAITVCHGLVQLLSQGGFPLTKWSSSSRRVLSTFDPTQFSQTQLNLDLDLLPTEKTLGVWWNSERDSFEFRVGQVLLSSEHYTKRQILRTVSGIYDPLGFLSPLVLQARRILRTTWDLNLGWDEPPPDSILEQWRQWCAEFQAVETLAIPRSLVTPGSLVMAEIHLFSDASEFGYGCVAYLRTTYDNDNVMVRFVCSKARVAPLKYLTIPRMELQAALIAFRLGVKIKQELRIERTAVTYWTDSTTVLHWMVAKGKRYHTFVANRVGEILEGSDSKQWRYVPSNQNPADICSRGLKSYSEVVYRQWLEGPEFLRVEPNAWPERGEHGATRKAETEELPPKWAGHISREASPFDDLLSKSSNVRTLRRIVAYVHRFVTNCRKRTCEKTSGELTLPEIEKANLICVSLTQREAFHEELDQLSRGKPVSKKSSILTLTPFVDADGVMRAQGRLERADLPKDAKHPLILPYKHNFSVMVIREAHLLLHHASVEMTWCEVRQRYWIVKGRQAVKRIINECSYCKRLRAKPMIPLMAPLPHTRLEAYSPPFTHVGIDYAGPLAVTVGRRTEKRYICLFTCLTTRAVHLEVSHSLDTDSFLMAFRRFTNRRGVPATVYSDNATNFIAGRKELDKGRQLWNQRTVNDEMIQKRIRWILSPPAAPHFGGVWERMIRAAKNALLRVLNGRSVKDEVLLTALSEVESLLNARPLTHVSINPSDPEPLTPNHFLLGRAHPHIPPDVVTESDVTSRRKWRIAQAIIESFWVRWLRCYVPSLIERKKWLKRQPQLRKGDIVLVVDDRSPRGHWPLGRVQECFPGKDGIVRTAKVFGKFGTYIRPVSKLCLFERSDNVSGNAPPETGPAMLPTQAVTKGAVT